MNKKKSLSLILAALMTTMLLSAACTRMPKPNQEKKEPEKITTVKVDTVKRITLLLAGDLMCQYGQQEYEQEDGILDFHREFDYVREIVQSADLAIGNLETNVAPSAPLGMEQHLKYDKPYLNAPVEFLEAVKDAGFDVMVNANNHNCDTGIEGLEETIAHQDAYGIRHTGIFKTGGERRYLIEEIQGIRIGIASYCTYLNRSERDFSEEQKNTHLNLYSEAKVRADIKAMRKDGAQFIVVYLHKGSEYQTEPTEEQKQYAAEIAEAGADFVAVSHAHTVQPYTTICTQDGRNVPVIYSLGNFTSQQTGPKSGLETLFEVKLEKKNGIVSILEQRYYPLLNIGPDEEGIHGYQVMPCIQAIYDQVENETVVEHMKRSREEIVRIIGNEINPVE